MFNKNDIVVFKDICFQHTRGVNFVIKFYPSLTPYFCYNRAIDGIPDTTTYIVKFSNSDKTIIQNPVNDEVYVFETRGLAKAKSPLTPGTFISIKDRHSARYDNVTNITFIKTCSDDIEDHFAFGTIPTNTDCSYEVLEVGFSSEPYRKNLYAISKAIQRTEADKAVYVISDDEVDSILSDFYK